MHYLKEQKPLLEEKEIDDIQKNINQIGSNFWQQYFKNRIKKVFNLLIKILPLFTFFIIVLGILHIYQYLKFVNYDFLFPDVIGEPSLAITIIMVQFLFAVTLAVGFLSPFLLNIFVYTESSRNDTYLILKIFHTLSICYTIFNFICFIMALFGNFAFDDFIYFSSFCFLILAIRACYVLRTYYKVKTTEPFILSLLVAIPYCLYFSSSLYPIVQTVADKENFVWLVFIISHLLIIFNSVMAIFYAKSQHKNQVFPTICIILVIFGYFHLIPYQNYEVSLHKPKFIEKTQNSSWYLIHNGNTKSDKINGLSETEIQNLKLEFKPQDKNVKNIENPNALYGYMAWNLGNTKVFCPVLVDFFKFTADEESRINQSKDIAKTKTEIQQEKSDKCLVIDGKYLQLVSGYYLK